MSLKQILQDHGYKDSDLELYLEMNRQQKGSLTKELCDNAKDKKWEVEYE